MLNGFGFPVVGGVHQVPADQGERGGVTSLHFLYSVLGFAIGDWLVIQSSDTHLFRGDEEYVRGIWHPDRSPLPFRIK